MDNGVRRFTQDDWCGFAGAEKFASGSEPWIYERGLGECELVIIADKNGVMVMLLNEEGQDSWEMNKPLSAIRALGEITHWVKEFENYEYAPDLSYELDHRTEFEYVG